ncbi:MAG: antibiotic biosynthesis monooxygenase [Proteobacteria bacterium]|nr:antibiotic biosynthesis monooxygenase [Pseudomonadota bacterium]MBU1687075.1 antibiotic biosynthesis monooxygenase [Pseudomonadota bacterium]
MILVIMYMKVSPTKRQELSQTITSLLGPIRAEKGCGRCDFFHDMDDEYALCLLQEWETRQDLEAYRRSECFKILRGAMNLLAEPCETISCDSLHSMGD